jgi:hypothetical protein
MLLPFPSSRDLPRAAKSAASNPGEAEEFDIDIETPPLGPDEPTFAFGSHDLIDTE